MLKYFKIESVFKFLHYRESIRPKDPVAIRQDFRLKENEYLEH